MDPSRLALALLLGSLLSLSTTCGRLDLGGGRVAATAQAATAPTIGPGAVLRGSPVPP